MKHITIPEKILKRCVKDKVLYKFLVANQRCCTLDKIEYMEYMKDLATEKQDKIVLDETAYKNLVFLSKFLSSLIKSTASSYVSRFVSKEFYFRLYLYIILSPESIAKSSLTCVLASDSDTFVKLSNYYYNEIKATCDFNFDKKKFDKVKEVNIDITLLNFYNFIVKSLPYSEKMYKFYTEKEQIYNLEKRR